jgi:tetratricopeptide (TPR) repeat protein
VAPADASIQFAVRPELYIQYREYLQGLYAARDGDFTAADRAATALETLGGSAEELKLAHNLALGVRSETALRQGRTDEALRLLEKLESRIPYLLRLTPFYSSARERYRRAELLQRAGRPEEALRWYSSLDDQSYFDAPYLAPSLLKRAEITERLGRKEEARALYRRALDLYHDPDPEFEPLRREMREGLDRIGRLP